MEKIKLYFLVASLLQLNLSFSAACEDESPFKRQKIFHTANFNPSAQAILDYLPAIHLTNVFPENGKMIAGSLNRFKVNEKVEICPFRKTLHFTLGEAVRNHGAGEKPQSWEERNMLLYCLLGLCGKVDNSVI